MNITLLPLTQFIIVISLLLSFSTTVNANAKIDQIRSNSLSNRVQVVLDLTQPAQYEAYSPDKSNSLIIDVQSTPSFDYKNTLSFNDRGITRVRTGALNNTSSRIVLELKHNYKWNVYSLPAKGKRKDRLVIEIFDKGKYEKPPKTTIARDEVKVNTHNEDIVTINNKKPLPKVILESTIITTPEKPTSIKTESIPPVVAVKPTSKPKSVAKPKPTPPIVAVAVEPAPKTKPVVKPKITPPIIAVKPVPKPIIKKTTPPIIQTSNKKTVIVIDPGHGGKDSGAIGAKKSKEKRLVLEIAKKLKAKIDKIPNMKAILTRSSDIYIPLRGRLAIARKHNADLFISIHADAFTRRSAKGSSVFVLSNRGASSEAARWLAKGENAVDLKYGVDIGDYNKDISDILVKIQQDATIESSYVLAKKTLAGMGKIGNLHKRTVERAGFAVLKSPDIPSILIETAFISNPEEERKLNSSAHQDKLAQSIANAVKKYFDEYLPHHLLLKN